MSTRNSLTIKTIPVSRPFTWLQYGWRDTKRAGWVSLIHGLILTLTGLFFFYQGKGHFLLLAGVVTAFLVVSPILATSLYALSRAMESGEAPSFKVVTRTWSNWQIHHSNKLGNDYWCLVQFGTLLGIAALGWLLTSASLVTTLSPVPIHTPQEFLKYVVLARNGYVFEIWMAVGGLLAAPIFASSVISIPLLLDRQISLKDAVLASWQVVLANPVPMAVWAALIAGMTILGFCIMLVGLIPVISILGHASWYAYRDTVDASALPKREAKLTGDLS